MSAAARVGAALGVADLVTFHDRPLAGPATPIDPARVTSGSPEERAEVLYEDASGEFLVGLWECTAGAFSVAFTEDEYVRLLAGGIRLTDAGGGSRTFAPGESFLVPSGFRGTWENVGDVRKIFVSLTRPEA